MIKKNVIDIDKLYYELKREILDNIKNKKIDTVVLANNMNMSVDKFNYYMDNNDNDFSIYLDMIKLVKAWEEQNGRVDQFII